MTTIENKRLWEMSGESMEEEGVWEPHTPHHCHQNNFTPDRHCVNFLLCSLGMTEKDDWKKEILTPTTDQVYNVTQNLEEMLIIHDDMSTKLLGHYP
jgi:hypothetical protein